MIVIDAVTSVHLVVELGSTDLIEQVLAKDSDWIVPPLWRSECLSALNKYRIRGDFDEGDTLTRFERAQDLVRIVDYAPADQVLALAARTGCSIYDSEYAQLALNHSIPFVTFDRQVIRAGVGTHPQDFLETR